MKLYDDEMKYEVTKVLGSKTATTMKVKKKTDSWWLRFQMKLFPQVKRSGAITVGYTMYVKDDFETRTQAYKNALAVHEATHVRQNIRFPLIHSLSYGIGSPWLLLMILLLFVPFLWTGVIIATISLALSTTGFIFPHIRTWWEYEAFRNGNIYTYRLYGRKNPELHIKYMKGVFSGWFYLWMGGFLSGWLAKRIDRQVRKKLNLK